jgi:hypothetical protein
MLGVTFEDIEQEMRLTVFLAIDNYNLWKKEVSVEKSFSRLTNWNLDKLRQDLLRSKRVTLVKRVWIKEERSTV